MRTVTMFVLNNCDRDARVLKEAQSLTEAGYSVRIIAILDKVTKPHEVRDGFVIDRVIRNPIHYRVLRTMRSSTRSFNVLFRKGINRGYRALASPLRMLRRLVGSSSIGNSSHPPFNQTRPKAVLPRSRWAQKCARALAHGLLRGVQAVQEVVYGIIRRILLVFHRPLSFLDFYIRAYHLAQSCPSDIYHAHDLNTLPVAWWARRKLGGILIYDSHEIYTETSTLKWGEKKTMGAIERFLIRRTDAVITIHESAARELSQRYGIPRPMIVMNCPRIEVNVANSHRLRTAVGLHSDDLIVLYQGGFLPNRGLKNLLCAMQKLPEQAKLVMMGWGKLENELKQLAQEMSLLDRTIYFIPPVPQKELLLWTASADVGVIPYQAVGLNNYYCLPNKIFEYMAAGLPIAASAFPELSRVINECEVGVTFEPESPESISHALLRILTDGGYRRQLSMNARRASETYNWSTEETKLLALYGELRHV